MKSDSNINTNIYGVATVGERGQIVIPAEARKSAGIQPGDRVVVIGHVPNTLMVVKMDAFKPFLLSMIEDFASLESKYLKDPEDDNE